MKLNYITFMVRDIEKSVAFYQELAGLDVGRRGMRVKSDCCVLKRTICKLFDTIYFIEISLRFWNGYS